MDKLNISTISIRGFDADIEDVVSLFGKEPAGFKKRGDKTLPHRTSLILKNSIHFECQIHDNELWDDAVLKILNVAGGISTLEKVVTAFSPEYIHIDLRMNISQSSEQKNGYISTEVLQQLVKVGASIGFSFA